MLNLWHNFIFLLIFGVLKFWVSSKCAHFFRSTFFISITYCPLAITRLKFILIKYLIKNWIKSKILLWNLTTPLKDWRLRNIIFVVFRRFLFTFRLNHGIAWYILVSWLFNCTRSQDLKFRFVRNTRSFHFHFWI